MADAKEVGCIAARSWATLSVGVAAVLAFTWPRLADLLIHIGGIVCALIAVLAVRPTATRHMAGRASNG